MMIEIQLSNIDESCPPSIAMKEQSCLDSCLDKCVDCTICCLCKPCEKFCNCLSNICSPVCLIINYITDQCCLPFARYCIKICECDFVCCNIIINKCCDGCEYVVCCKCYETKHGESSDAKVVPITIEQKN
jgi:hypothetical protein